MAAARPSAHNAEFRVFILVLRRLRPVFVVPRARLRVRRESPPAAGLGEWQTACRGCEKRRENWSRTTLSTCSPPFPVHFRAPRTWAHRSVVPHCARLRAIVIEVPQLHVGASRLPTLTSERNI